MEKLFKNWSEICIAGRIDPLFMFWIACLDLSDYEDLNSSNFNREQEVKKRNERRRFAREITSLMPKYFSENNIHGPVPVSLIIQKTNECVSKETGQTPNKKTSRCPQSHGVLGELSLPYLTFVWDADELREDEGEILISKDMIDQYDQNDIKTKQWDVFVYKGAKIVLAEYRSGDPDFCDYAIDYFIPLSCVALDL